MVRRRGRLGSARAQMRLPLISEMVALPLPEGPGDAQSPEEPRDRAQQVFEERMAAFADNTGQRKLRRRVSFSDYTAANCEEAWGNRPT